MSKTLRGGDGRAYVIPDQFTDPVPEKPPLPPPPTAREILATISMGWGMPMPAHGDWSPQQINYLQQLQQTFFIMGGAISTLTSALVLVLNQIEADEQQ